MANPLRGLASQWEKDADGRTYFREKRRMYQGHISGCDPPCTVITAAKNKSVILPVVACVAKQQGKLPKIGQFEEQPLSHMRKHFLKQLETA